MKAIKIGNNERHDDDEHSRGVFHDDDTKIMKGTMSIHAVG